MIVVWVTHKLDCACSSSAFKFARGLGRGTLSSRAYVSTIFLQHIAVGTFPYGLRHILCREGEGEIFLPHSAARSTLCKGQVSRKTQCPSCVWTVWHLHFFNNLGRPRTHDECCGGDGMQKKWVYAGVHAVARVYAELFKAELCKIF